MIEKSIECSNEDIFNSKTFPLTLIDDLTNLSSIEQLGEIFSFFQKNIQHLKIDKLIIFKMCKRIQKRLSKSNHIVLCSKISLFLSQILPITERSSLNLGGFISTNQVITNESDSEVMASQFYESFWKLQDFIKSNSNSLDREYETILNTILNSFENIKYEKIFQQQDEFFVPKYLTNKNLLTFELSDSKFIFQILIQLLISFKNIEKKENVEKFETKIFQLVERISSNEMLTSIKIIFEREDNWIEWKKGKCMEEIEYQPFQPSDETMLDQEQNPLYGSAELMEIFESNNEKVENFVSSKENFLAPMSANQQLQKLRDQLDPESGIEKEESLLSNKIHSFKIQRSIMRDKSDFLQYFLKYDLENILNLFDGKEAKETSQEEEEEEAEEAMEEEKEQSTQETSQEEEVKKEEKSPTTTTLEEEKKEEKMVEEKKEEKMEEKKVEEEKDNSRNTPERSSNSNNEITSKKESMRKTPERSKDLNKELQDRLSEIDKSKPNEEKRKDEKRRRDDRRNSREREPIRRNDDRRGGGGGYTRNDRRDDDKKRNVSVNYLIKSMVQILLEEMEVTNHQREGENKN
jgi:hypothetical protein